jgi:hypothetical protein
VMMMPVVVVIAVVRVPVLVMPVVVVIAVVRVPVLVMPVVVRVFVGRLLAGLPRLPAHCLAPSSR